MIQDGLVFARFMFKEFGKKKFSDKDLHLISAGVNGAATMAERMAFATFNQENKDKAKKVASAAKSLNRQVRELLTPPKNGKKPKGITMEDGVKLEAALSKLEKKTQKFSEDMEKLCYVDRYEGRKPKMSGALPYTRTQMGAAQPPFHSATAAPAPSAAPQGQETLKKHVYPAFRRPALHKSIKSIRRIPL